MTTIILESIAKNRRQFTALHIRKNEAAFYLQHTNFCTYRNALRFDVPSRL